MDGVLLTGANRGLGLEFARQYAEAGWRVHACARRESVELTRLAASNQTVVLHQLDVTSPADITRLSERLAKEPLDVLINNAGVLGKRSFDNGAGRDQAFGQTDYQDWECIFRTNVMAPMRIAEAFVTQVASSHQRKIIMMSSVLGSMKLNTTGGLYGYRTSKSAVNAITKSMSVDLAERGIIVVALHPGWVRTTMGGRNATLDAGDSVASMLRLIASLKPEDSGKFIAYNGEVLPY